MLNISYDCIGPRCDAQCGLAAAKSAGFLERGNRMSNTIRVYVPTGKVQAPGVRDAMRARRRAGAQLVVGMLDNHKHNTDKVLDRLQHRLSERYGDARFVRVKKPEAGKPAPGRMLADLAGECDAVVTGIAD